MNELKVVARLTAQERGEAVRVTRQRPYPLSSRPLVVVPLVMAGESPALFALGVGDGSTSCRIYACAEPRNRDEQYAMLGLAAADIEKTLAHWAADSSAMPQIITSSRDALRLFLATVHRMTYAPLPELKRVGRQLHWLGRAFERADSGALLDMPSALCQLYATGQDDHADAHLGAVLEWMKPADGRIYDRILHAEQRPASTSTDPQLDNKKLVPLVERLGEAERAGDTARVGSIRDDIGGILAREIESRYGLIREALAICRRFPASAAATHIETQDRAQHERNFAYVADPENHLAGGLSGNAAMGEFLSRELSSDHVEQLKIRSVSAVRGAARLAGDVLVGEVVAREERKVGRKMIVTYRVVTTQDRLPIRRGDKLTPIEDGPFTFCVTEVALGASGATTVTLELTNGKTKSGQPERGEHIELAQPLPAPERIARTMGIAQERFRTNPPLRQVGGPLAPAPDYLSAIRAMRRDQ